MLNLAHFSGTGPQLSDRDLFYLASAGYLDKDKKSLESITPKGIIAVNMVGVEIDGVDGDISCYLREPFADVSILGIIRNLALNRTTSVLI